MAQIGKGLATERCRILGELWKNGIAAEMLYHDNPKVPKQIQFALDTGVPLILWLGEDEIKKGVVKVKCLNLKEEFLIERENMVQRVQELIKMNPVLLSQEEQALLGKPDQDVAE